MLAEYSSTTLLFQIREARPCGDQGFQIRDLQVAYRFNASHFTTSTHSMRSSTASANLFIFVASILALSTASGQTAPAGRFPEPLEKYEMVPPARIYRLESSPRMISPYGAFISYQVNVDANGMNIVGDAANEPSISVDPTDGNKIAIGWRQFDTWTSNFREAGCWLHHRCWHYVAFPRRSGKQCFPQRSSNKLR